MPKKNIINIKMERLKKDKNLKPKKSNNTLYIYKKYQYTLTRI